MNRPTFAKLVVAAAFLMFGGVAQAQEQCLLGTGAFTEDAVVNDNGVDNLSAYAAIFHDLRIKDANGGYPCDSPTMHLARDWFPKKIARQPDFTGFLIGGSVAFAYGSGALLGVRHELPAETDATLNKLGFEPRAGNCRAHVNEGWPEASDCIDEISVATEGFAWRALYFHFSGRDDKFNADRRSAIDYINQTLFDFDSSICLDDESGYPGNFDTVKAGGPCNGTLTGLEQTLGLLEADQDAKVTVLVPLHHHQENSNYGIGLVCTLANAYMALQIAHDPVNDTDYHGYGGITAGAADAKAIYKALWLEGQRTAGPSPNSEVNDEAWDFKCYTPLVRGVNPLTSTDFDPANRNRLCYDQTNPLDPTNPKPGGYKPSLYPVALFYDKYVENGFRGYPNKFRFDQPDTTRSIFVDGSGTLKDPEHFRGVLRYEVYYVLTHQWLADSNSIPTFGVFAAPSCPPDPALSAITTAPSLFAGQGGFASVPATPGATYEWSIEGGTLESDPHANAVGFVAGTGDHLTLTVRVTPECGTVSVGTATVQILPAPNFIRVDEKFVTSGVVGQYRATVQTAFSNAPVPGVLLDFKVLGIDIGTATTDADGVATIPYILTTKPGFYRDGIVVSAPNDPGIKTATGNLNVNCAAGAYTVVPDTLNVTSEGVTGFVFQMRTTCDFDAAPDVFSPFVHVTEIDEGKGTFTVTVDRNQSGAARIGGIYAGGVKRININQSAANNCNFSFSPAIAFMPDDTPLVLDPNTGQLVHPTTQITISAPPGCTWNLGTPTQDWLHLASFSPADHTGPGTINVWADRNDNPARTASIPVIGGLTSTGQPAKAVVNQQAPPPCSTAFIIEPIWGGGDITNRDQDVVVGIGAKGTRLVYEWTITGYPDGHVVDFQSGNQIILRDGNPWYPAPGQTLQYHVFVRNECTGNIDGGSVTYHNSGGATCDAPFILGHPSLINSPRANAVIQIGVDARDCGEVLVTCGSDPADLTYQWYAGTTGDHRNPIFNAIHPGLFVSPGQTSFYWCEVAKPCVDSSGNPILDSNGNPVKVKSQSGTAMVVVPPAFKPPAVGHDFTGDGQNDLVWHNPTSGATELWQMFGTAHTNTIAMPSNNADLQTIGDFDGDGKPDLVWRNPQTGANSVWNMRGTQLNGVGTLEPRTGAEWVIGAAADLDADDEHDLVWHNKNTGENEIWFQNGTGHTGTWELPSTPDNNWGLHGAADFSGDTKPDLFFHNRVTGENSIWILGHARVATIASDGSTTTTVKRFRATAQSVDSLPDPNWVPAQIVDLDGDGKPDIVWRNNVTGENMVWVMNGLNHVSSASLETRPDTTWQIGGGGSTNSSPGPTGGTQTATSLSVVATPAYLNTATAITATLTANNAPLAGKTIHFSVNGNSVAQLVTDENGTATAGASVAGISSGTYANAVSVSFDGDANDLASSATTDLVITGIKPVITWSDPASIVYGTPLNATQLNATANVPGTFVYSPAAGTILDAGYNLLGTTFTPADASVAPITANVLIFVQKGTASIAWPSPAPISYGTRLSPAQLNAIANVPGAFTYDPSFGALLDPGTQTLHATFTPSSINYDVTTATTTINVGPGSQTISWPQPVAITYGTPISATQLDAIAIGSGTAPAGALAYNVAAGTILNAGPHTLTVTAAATPFYNSATASVTLIVVPATPSITWANPAPIVYGTPLSAAQLNASAPVAGTFAYSPAAGTILNAGNGQPLSVTFTSSDPNYGSATTSVTVDVLKAQQTITWTAPAPIVYGTPLSSTQLNATATTGTLTYNPPAGTVLNAGDGQTLTVTAAATANYNAATASVTIDVKKAHPTITWATPAPIIYGTLLTATQLNATANVPGAFAYTPAAGTKLDAGSQTLSVLFTPTDTNNYETETASVTLVVQRATPVITWPHPAGIVYGTALDATQLNATADVAGTFVYTPAAGTILNAGASQTLSVHFTPDDTRNYNEASATTTIDVAKAKQTLSWTTPASIVYGTPLSAAQLNASVTVVGPAAAGALVYSPAAGTVLDAGSHTLTVTAQETPNYLSATTSVSIDVTRAPLSLIVDPKSKLYGAALPLFTGTLTGVMNNDAITPAYATTATQQSVTGTYPITATLLDPNHRLFNYNVTIVPSTLTVLPAPLLVSANAASKQYSDPLPQLTATFTGFVLGETPAVLSGTLSITTTAGVLSAPGSYPISIGGLTSTNYAIAYAGATFTVTPEDARVAITSPTLVSPSTITLSATVKDFDDGFPGDIRNASLTFVDRTTHDVLCSATIVLFDAADARLGVGSCTFTHASVGTITVGAQVGNYYVRDDAADDVTLTIVTPTTDSITGSGTTTGGAFNLSLQYDSHDAVKGSFTFRYVQDNHTYEIAATSVESLGITRTTNGGKAAIVGLATLRDVTNSKNPITLDAAARLIATATDDGEPANDRLSITLLKSGGGVWLATAWNGTAAGEQSLTSGNIQVHYGK